MSCGHCEEIVDVFLFKFFCYGNANTFCLSEKKKWGRVAQAMVSSLVRLSCHLLLSLIIWPE